MHVVKLVIFAGGSVRLSTVLGLAAFALLAVARRDWRPAAAAVVWMVGYEAAFTAAQRFSHDHRDGLVHGAVWAALLAPILVLLARRGVRLDLRLLTPAVVLFAVWMVTGFHVNPHSGLHFDPVAEALNEASKMLCAAAYLLPLLRSGELVPGGSAAPSTGREHGNVIPHPAARSSTMPARR